jgi:hypothetical protein
MLEHCCREMVVSKGENCKESGGWPGGGRDGPFDKYNDRKFILDCANNYSTDITQEIFYVQINIDNFRARVISLMFSTQHIIKEGLKYLEYQLQICTALTDLYVFSLF